MSSPVYSCDLRASAEASLAVKIARLLAAAGLEDVLAAHDLTAVKVHFGEPGNTAFIRHIHLAGIVEQISACGAAPFLTDSNTLYRGERSNGVAHARTACRHGFVFGAVSAPVLIADGLRGNDGCTIDLDGRHFATVEIASAIAQADALVCVSHFKGHELSGFGGALKNLGMGCATRKGKMQQHTDIKPVVDQSRCVRCGRCQRWCPADAMTVDDYGVQIEMPACIGCAECIAVCSHDAVGLDWACDTGVFQEKMAEYAAGALRGKEDKALFVSFLTDISPACDCYGYADYPLVADIGVLASRDPVAIDQAGYDLVGRAPVLERSCLTGRREALHPFRQLYPAVDPTVQMRAAESLGIGTRRYQLQEVC